jgi:HD-GYP domain-containing protein (c-di-GMP phosphodiesterase class II)
MLKTAGDVARALAHDPLLDGWALGVPALSTLGDDRSTEPASTSDGFLEIQRGAAVLVLCWPGTWLEASRLAPHMTRARSGTYSLVLVGSAEELALPRIAEIADDLPRLLLLTVPTAPRTMAVWLRGLGEGERLLREMADLERSLDRARFENELLIDIGRSLSRQRDHLALLDLILRRARELTGADAGSVYVVEGDDDAALANRTLRFVGSQNDSIEVSSDGFTMPVSPSSIVGACVLSGQVVNIPDLYALDAPGEGNNPWGFKHDRSFDTQHDYQTRSMITVPMISARSQVIGVLQLINKRSRGTTTLLTASDFVSKVVPFDEVSTEFVATLASQAGIALENALLHAEVRTLFEGFVKASVTAIEARDPTTSGHSERVSILTLGLARVADRADSGTYASLAVSRDDLKQIEYAALLHDFGKVGVREHVLVKAKKLYEHERALIEARFEVIKRTLEAERDGAKVRSLLASSRAELGEQLAAAQLAEIDRDASDRLLEIDDFIRFILKANQPSVLEEGGLERIAVIAGRSFVGSDGSLQPYLTAAEAGSLQIARGSLNEDERRAIEQHVVHTYNFLRQIPWGKTFRQVPEIAVAHHEKLDGTGYPNQRHAADISPAARMMAISDIYDALTASDRPYKRAVPIPKALEIIESEVDRNKLDRELFDMFVTARVWEQLAQRQP